MVEKEIDGINYEGIQVEDIDNVEEDEDEEVTV